MRGLSWIIQQFFYAARVFFVLMVALFLPHLCIWNSKPTSYVVPKSEAPQFRLGLENIADSSLVANCIANKLAIGLVTNQTGTDQTGNRNIDLLLSRNLNIKKILVPHGCPAYNEEKKIPVISMAKKEGHVLLPLSSIKDIDVLLFDMQDSGVRYHGFIVTLLDIMEAAAKYNKKFIILDRPNLLGWCMEGGCPSTQFPMRHGMTVGELAHYCNKYLLEKPLDLHVVSMAHYNRQADSRSSLLSSLSPNITSIDSCYGYSFLGLLGEVAPFDIGIGTDKAFQCVLLPEHLKFPKQKWQELRTVLKGLGIESKVHRYYSARKKQYCSGLRLHINDINHFSSFNTLVTMLTFFKNAGLKLTFTDQFDKASGNNHIRLLVQGALSRANMASMSNDDTQSFFKRASSCFLYKPYPKILQV